MVYNYNIRWRVGDCGSPRNYAADKQPEAAHFEDHWHNDLRIYVLINASV